MVFALSVAIDSPMAAPFSAPSAKARQEEGRAAMDNALLEIRTYPLLRKEIGRKSVEREENQPERNG